MSIPFITAEEAASYIKNGDNVAFSGFTASGTPKVVTVALAERAKKLHEEGKPFKINVFTGASTNDHVDGELARANAVAIRTPYQSHSDMRKSLNSAEMNYFDLHLSHLSQDLRYGFYGDIDVAIIEATEMSPNGEVILGAGLGMTPTIAQLAKKVIIEYSSYYRNSFRGFHDNYVPQDPPHRREIPIYKPSDRIGSTVLKIDPKKIIGVVPSNASESIKPFTAPDEVSQRISENICHFLASQLREGRIPKEFLPIQSGVGNVANAVLYGLGENPEIPQFEMYTEVIQDAVMHLMEQGRCKFASTCALTFSDDAMLHFMDNIDFFRDKVLMRPGEISNSPEIVRRLGLIAMNTALEADIFGNVNSTHVLGTKMMNGIGGSADFCRNAYLSIFSCPSIQKGGKISTIVPMVSHLDHSEHSVKILATEQGVADLRGKDPRQRAETIIENCVHPMYKELMWDYLKLSKGGHTPHTLKAAFALHHAFSEKGDMLEADFAKFV
ncbi:MAG: succinate CoA transferase [Muribaculaceae bacterium]|jgi:succinate CoA transferase|uniref:succinate CoA transferase n=1 Tax=Sangeribacter muris TaxID=2880703 RepID=UPI000F51AA65|nr:succinate CoA transferase [Sangeribacter muris]MBJ2193360.1 succinate CoA transferase [Muribaculaceae bacterium]MCX4280176.1 succinate CoA transferase [Muribaculaceae bacterium]ROS82009.1 succinate CoA transferase [Muribaculaceae bacterium Isolate-036 (Harlan)]RXE66367.1 succinate CoA transferase [Muribaculaceae bacterium Isolate-001 (NCI)]